jgi:hypothetical protein
LFDRLGLIACGRKRCLELKRHPAKLRQGRM